MSRGLVTWLNNNILVVMPLMWRRARSEIHSPDQLPFQSQADGWNDLITARVRVRTCFLMLACRVCNMDFFVPMSTASHSWSPGSTTHWPPRY